VNWQNLLQIAPFAVLIGFSLLNWLVRKLREQAELKKIEAERRRREVEALRTGRGGGEPSPTAVAEARQEGAATQSDAQARARLEELAARRRAQLEELRRRQQQRRTGATGTTAPQGPTPQAPVPQTRMQQRSTSQAPRGAQTQSRAPTAASGGFNPRQALEQQQRKRDSKSNKDKALRQKSYDRIAAEQRSLDDRVAQAKADAAAAERDLVAVRAKTPKSYYDSEIPVALSEAARAVRTPADIRKAIIVSELLAAPVSLRKPGENDLGPRS
jgi:hypothetical protein